MSFSSVFIVAFEQSNEWIKQLWHNNPIQKWYFTAVIPIVVKELLILVIPVASNIQILLLDVWFVIMFKSTNILEKFKVECAFR